MNNAPKLNINFKGKVIDILPSTKSGYWIITLGNNENILRFEYEGYPNYKIHDNLYVTGEVKVDLGLGVELGQLLVINRKLLGFFITKLHSVNAITIGE